MKNKLRPGKPTFVNEQRSQHWLEDVLNEIVIVRIPGTAPLP